MDDKDESIYVVHMDDIKTHILWPSFLLGNEPRFFDVVATIGVAAATGLVAFLWSGSAWLGLVAADVGGGVIANATESTSGWYAARPRWVHVLFVVLHFAHVALGALWGGGSLFWVAGLFCATSVGVAVVRLVPSQMAMTVALAAVVLGASLLTPLPAFPPFAALFLLKLVFGFGLHAKRSSPMRPEERAAARHQCRPSSGLRVDGRVPTSLYVLNLALLSTHQADAAYWHEWNVFGVPGGLEFFLVFNLVAVIALAAGLVAVATRHRHSRAWSQGCAAVGAFTFGIHAVFLASDPTAFSEPISIGILVATLVTSAAQLALVSRALT